MNATTNVFQVAGSTQIIPNQYWMGQTSEKFNYSERRHVPEPKFREVPHPLYSTFGKRHIHQDPSDSYQWKPSIRVDPNKEVPRPEKDRGMKKVGMKFTEMKDRYERKHNVPNESGSYEDLEIGKMTYVHHNRKTIDEYHQEGVMGKKKRIQTLYDKRNGLPVKSLGDKVYKAPEYTPHFYKEGGLIVGSSNVQRNRTGGNAKAIDFYAGLSLDKGPLNPNRKTWKQAVKEEQLNEEMGSVQSLKNWERTILKEVDPKYQISDDEEEPDQKKK